MVDVVDVVVVVVLLVVDNFSDIEALTFLEILPFKVGFFTEPFLGLSCILELNFFQF